jgi:hypothetical protein
LQRNGGAGTGHVEQGGKRTHLLSVVSTSNVYSEKIAGRQPKYRFCIDFRALNSVSQFDTYPLTNFEQTMSTPYGSKYFSVVDSFSGFWQIRIAEKDKMKKAFSTPSGHFQF